MHRASTSIVEIRQPVCLIFSVLCFLHVVALCCVLFCPIPWYDKFFLSVSVLAYFIYAVLRYVLSLSKHSVVKAYRYQGGQWRLQFRDGKTYPAELLQDSVTTRLLAVLTFRLPGKRQRVSLIYCPLLL